MTPEAVDLYYREEIIPIYKDGLQERDKTIEAYKNAVLLNLTLSLSAFIISCIAIFQSYSVN